MNKAVLGLKIIALVNFLSGIFLLGWFFKASNYFTVVLSAMLSSCPCTILAKIGIIVIVLMIILFIKNGVQLLQLNQKGRADHINISSFGIFILLFPVIFGHNKDGFSITAIICGSIIAYLAWSIFYLNLAKMKKLFN